MRRQRLGDQGRQRAAVILGAQVQVITLGEAVQPTAGGLDDEASLERPFVPLDVQAPDARLLLYRQFQSGQPEARRSLRDVHGRRTGAFRYPLDSQQWVQGTQYPALPLRSAGLTTD